MSRSLKGAGQFLFFQYIVYYFHFVAGKVQIIQTFNVFEKLFFSACADEYARKTSPFKRPGKGELTDRLLPAFRDSL